MSETELRITCLKLAAAAEGLHYTQVLDVAQMYYEFLLGVSRPQQASSDK